MGGIVSGIFGGKKSDTSAIDEQIRLQREQAAASKEEADRLRSESALKSDAMRRRRAGYNSLIATSPTGVANETLG